MIEKLINDIRTRNLRLTILGSGYVGLPTAALFANAGFHVIAVDIRPEVVKSVNSKVSPINEPGLKKLLSDNVRVGRLRATLNSVEALNQSDAVIISVQTPINENKKPNLSFLMEAIEEVGMAMKRKKKECL